MEVPTNASAPNAASGTVLAASNPVTVLNTDVVVLVVLVLVVSAASCVCTVIGYLVLERINVRKFFATPERTTYRCASCSRRRGSPRSGGVALFSPGGADARCSGRRGRSNLRNSQSVHPSRKPSFRGPPSKLVADDDEPTGNEKDSLFGALGINSGANGHSFLQPLARQLENRNLSPIQQTPPGIRVIENDGGRMTDMPQAGRNQGIGGIGQNRDDSDPTQRAVYQNQTDIGGGEVSVYINAASESSRTTSSSEYDVQRVSNPSRPMNSAETTSSTDDIYSKIEDPVATSSTKKAADAAEAADFAGAPLDVQADAAPTAQVGSPGSTAPSKFVVPLRLSERQPPPTSIRSCHDCGQLHNCAGVRIGNQAVGSNSILRLATPRSQFAREMNFNEQAMMKDSSIMIQPRNRNDF